MIVNLAVMMSLMTSLMMSLMNPWKITTTVRYTPLEHYTIIDFNEVDMRISDIPNIYQN